MKDHTVHGPYLYAKACYRCGWFTQHPAASDLCGQCGQHSVVYAEGQIVTEKRFYRFRGWKTLSQRFEIHGAVDIGYLKHVGRWVDTTPSSVESYLPNNPHLVTEAVLKAIAGETHSMTVPPSPTVQHRPMALVVIDVSDLTRTYTYRVFSKEGRRNVILRYTDQSLPEVLDAMELRYTGIARPTTHQMALPDGVRLLSCMVDIYVTGGGFVVTRLGSFQGTDCYAVSPLPLTVRDGNVLSHQLVVQAVPTYGGYTANYTRNEGQEHVAERRYQNVNDGGLDMAALFEEIDGAILQKYRSPTTEAG